jgi:hypothetical protein
VLPARLVHEHEHSLPPSWRVAWLVKNSFFLFNPSLAGFKCCLWWQLAAEASFVQGGGGVLTTGDRRKGSRCRHVEDRWGGWRWRGCCVLGAEDKSIEELIWWLQGGHKNGSAEDDVCMYAIIAPPPENDAFVQLQGQIVCWASRLPACTNDKKTVGLLKQCMHWSERGALIIWQFWPLFFKFNPNL